MPAGVQNIPRYTPEELAKARKYEINYREFGGLKARFTGGQVITQDDVEVMACPFMFVFNGLFPPHWRDADCEAKFRTAVRLYQQVRQGLSVLLGPSANHGAMRKVLLNYGVKCFYWAPYMHLDFKDLNTKLPRKRGFSVKQVTDFKLFRDYGHPYHGKISTKIRRLEMDFAESLCAGPRPKAMQFAVIKDGVPLSSALVFRYKGTAAIYDVGTVREARRQGLGTVAMQAASKAARDMGCTCAVLSASSAGFGLYEKVGFRVVGRYAHHFISKDKLQQLARRFEEEAPADLSASRTATQT